jgi:hypothetical protein
MHGRDVEMLVSSQTASTPKATLLELLLHVPHKAIVPKELEMGLERENKGLSGTISGLTFWSHS